MSPSPNLEDLSEPFLDKKQSSKTPPPSSAFRLSLNGSTVEDATAADETATANNNDNSEQQRMASPQSVLKETALFHEILQNDDDDDKDYDEDYDDEMKTWWFFMGRHYLRTKSFWRTDLPLGIVIGILSGLFSIVFFGISNVTYSSLYHPPTHSDDDDDDTPPLSLGNVSLGSGEWWWFLTLLAAGVLTSLIGCLSCMPPLTRKPSLISDISRLRIPEDHIKEAPFVCLSCLIPFAMGYSIGPEAGLAPFGAAMGGILGRWCNVSERSRGVLVNMGVAGVVASIFRSPILGIVLMLEMGATTRGDPRVEAQVRKNEGWEALGTRDADAEGEESVVEDWKNTMDDTHDWMEQMTLLTVPIIIAFYLFRCLVVGLDEQRVILRDISDFEPWHFLAAVPIGLLAGLCSGFYFLLVGISKKILISTVEASKRRSLPSWAPRVALCLLGGLIQAIIFKIFPITLGSGMNTLDDLLVLGFNSTAGDYGSPDATEIYNGDSEPISRSMLFWAAVAKLFATGLIQCWFVGGLLFPAITSAAMIGFAVSMYMPALGPSTLVVPCFMAALPAGCMTLPLTCILIVMVMLVITPEAAGPILISVVCSFALWGGTGVMVMVQKKHIKLGNRDSGSVSERETDWSTSEDDRLD